MVLRQDMPAVHSVTRKEKTMLWMKKIPVSVALLTLLVVYFFATGALP